MARSAESSKRFANTRNRVAAEMHTIADAAARMDRAWHNRQGTALFAYLLLAHWKDAWFSHGIPVQPLFVDGPDTADLPFLSELAGHHLAQLDGRNPDGWGERTYPRWVDCPAEDTAVGHFAAVTNAFGSTRAGAQCLIKRTSDTAFEALRTYSSAMRDAVYTITSVPDIVDGLWHGLHAPYAQAVHAASRAGWDNPPAIAPVFCMLHMLTRNVNDDVEACGLIDSITPVRRLEDVMADRAMALAKAWFEREPHQWTYEARAEELASQALRNASAYDVARCAEAMRSGLMRRPGVRRDHKRGMVTFDRLAVGLSRP